MKEISEHVVGSQSAALNPANDDFDVLLGDLSEHVRREVGAGFLGYDDILQSAIDSFAGELPEALIRERGAALLEQAFATHLAEEVNWPAMTDCDRLDVAFAALDSAGIIARQNFSCCGTCGSAEIQDEIEAITRAGTRVYGYAFYHAQDTESAIDGYGLYLNYGAVIEGEEPAVAAGHAIVAALRHHGLKTVWDGSWGKRIGVTLDWKRRRAGPR